MHPNALLRTIATELPTLVRQLESTDPALRAAAVQRLRDFAQMTEAHRATGGHRTTSRRNLLRAGAGFVALSLKHDD